MDLHNGKGMIILNIRHKPKDFGFVFILTLWEAFLTTGEKYIYTHKSSLGGNFLAFGII